MTDYAPCPSCFARSASLVTVGEYPDWAVECAQCGTRGPRARAVDVESIPNLAALYAPGKDVPDDREVARLAWNRISNRAHLGAEAVGWVEVMFGGD